MKPGDCPTLGCLETTPHFSAHYDHLGRRRTFCIVHGGELLGVRERISALLAQIEGMNAVAANVVCSHAIPQHPYFITGCIRCAVNVTLQQQGAALCVLIVREIALTGADKP